MGSVLSRWRKKESTIEVLEQLTTEISALEETRSHNQQLERHIAFYLMLYSVLLYAGGSLLCYLYLRPRDWIDWFLYSLPFLLFPLLVLLVKRFLHWYFVKRVHQNEKKLNELKKKKDEKLEEVKEHETYKKAMEILEKFDPDRLRDYKNLSQQANRASQATPGAELRRRGAGVSGPRVTPRLPPPGTPVPPGSAVLSRPLLFSAPRAEAPLPSSTPTVRAPGPPLPRPIPSHKRSLVDRLMEYVVGDGPQNKLALICSHCASHNGMALPEEFEYLSYRCCYCFHLNPARKKRPNAPRIEPTPPSTPPRPTKSSEDEAAGDDSATEVDRLQKPRKEEDEESGGSEQSYELIPLRIEEKGTSTCGLSEATEK